MTDSTMTLKEPVKAKSSFIDAFTSLFNLFMIGSISLFIIMNFISFIVVRVDLWRLFLTIFAIMFLARYIRAILNRSLEINNEGIEYNEATRNVSLKWHEIEAIKIENYIGQITFWVNGKKTRIHTFGLNRREQVIVKETLVNQIKARNIKLR